MKCGQERSVATRLILLTTGWSCLCGWGQISWLINYPGKLDVALGCLAHPTSFQQCHRALQLSWVRDWEGPSLPHGLFEQLSSVVSMFSPSCRFYPISLRQFLSSCSFLLELFCSISKLSKLLIWELTFAALSFQTRMCFSFLLQCSREYHRMFLLKSY